MKLTVLLVEDNELNRDMLSRRLTRASYKVLTAGDGVTALETIRQAAPDVVLLDMDLPIKDGWTTCREVREDASICSTRIIALTAHAMIEDKKRAMQAGCDDYATKPVDFPKLLLKIQQLVAKKDGLL